MGILRLALALAVLLAHARSPWRPMDQGLAVQLFFIISGFYMALVLDGKYRSLGLFYSNRLLRLFPSYLVVLIAAFVALQVFGINAYVTRAEFAAAFGWETAAPLAFTNLLILGQDILVWFNLDPAGPSLVFNPTLASAPGYPAWNLILIPQAWSVSLELMFYAVAPFIVAGRTRIVLGLLVASVLLSILGEYLGLPYDLWPRRSFPAELCLFLLGVLAYRWRGYAAALPGTAGWVLLGALMLLFAFHRQLPLPTALTFPATYIVVAASLPVLFATFGRKKWDTWIGDLSYPVYLTHILAIAIIDAALPYWGLGGRIGLTLALSLALILFVERPVDAWRQRRVAAATTGR